MKESLKRRIVGGFTALNEGDIHNSYSLVSPFDKNGLTGGFVGKNEGQLVDSYACRGTLKLTGGLSGANTGEIKNSFFIHSIEEKKISKFTDSDVGVHQDTFSLQSDILERADGYSPIQFQDEKWYQQVEKNFIEGRHHIALYTTRDLLEFRDRVNQGDVEAQKAYVTLEEDVDLGGQPWVSIGNTYGAIFQGIFDGQCHTIKGLKCNRKEAQFQGLFGVLRGEVYNLSVEAQISGGEVIGGIAAQNEGKVIASAAIVSMKGDKTTRYAGALVGRNKGTIEKCYTSGKVEMRVFTPVMMGICATLALAVSLCAISIAAAFHSPNVKPTFKPVPVDTRQEKMSKEEDKEDTPTDAKNRIAYSVNETAVLSLSTKECHVEIKNPSSCNKKMVATIKMKDANGEEFTIADTDAIEPGNKISDVTVEDFAIESLAVGKYLASVQLEFYGEDNSKSIFQVNVGVNLEVTE